MKKMCWVGILLLMVTTLSIRAADHPVFNVADLNNALQAAVSGERILIHRGNYVGNFEVPAGVALLGEPAFMPAGGLMPMLMPWDEAPIVTVDTVNGDKFPTQVRGIFFTGAKDSAVDVQGDGVGYVCGNLFEQNRGPRGGAIFTEAVGTLYIQTNYFSNNSAETDGGAVYLGGAAKVYLRRNEFMGNAAGANGGGVCVRGKNKVFSDHDLFMSNRAVQDGGIAAILGNQQGFILYEVTATDNNAGRDGGGVAVDEASVLVAYGQSDTSRAGRHGGFLSARKGVALMA
ncbi:MAG: hypothetical protein KJ726_02600, partial [Verrucomicrobia bacterium]|nr:hypothetical protein [Verrucomicrobiota bacterium]